MPNPHNPASPTSPILTLGKYLIDTFVPAILPTFNCIAGVGKTEIPSRKPPTPIAVIVLSIVTPCISAPGKITYGHVITI